MNINKHILLGIFAIVGLAACKKSNLPPAKQNENPIAMSADQPASSVISIDAYSDYQAVIAQPAGTPIPNTPSDFVSMKSVLNQLDSLKQQGADIYYSSPNIGDTIYEDYGRLLDVLNQDKIVELNGKYVKVDLANDSAYMIDASLENAYYIINHNVPNPNLKSFSTALNLSIYIWVQIKFPPIGGCHDKSAKKRKEKKYRYCENDKYRTKEKLVYQKAGIYFSVLAKAKNQHKSLGFWWSWNGGQPGLYMTLSWKVKCGPIQPYWSGYAASWIGPGQPFSGNAHKASFRPYSSTMPLTNYVITCSFHTPCGVGDFLKISYP